MRKAGLGAGPTNRGLNAGMSKRTGAVGGFTTRARGTRGGTTTESRQKEETEYQFFNGERYYVKPKPLMVMRST
jgi:hypothetical protein